MEISIEKLKETIKNQPMNHVQRTKDQNQIEDLKREIAFIKEKKKHQLNLRDEEDIKLSEIKQKVFIFKFIYIFLFLIYFFVD